jgi:hypothetical protein
VPFDHTVWNFVSSDVKNLILGNKNKKVYLYYLLQYYSKKIDLREPPLKKFFHILGYVSEAKKCNRLEKQPTLMVNSKHSQLLIKVHEMTFD